MAAAGRWRGRLADGPSHGALDRCRPALAADPGCVAPARQQRAGIQRPDHAAWGFLRIRADPGWPYPGAARQLRPWWLRPAARHGHRRLTATFRDLRSARGSGPTKRRDEDRK